MQQIDFQIRNALGDEEADVLDRFAGELPLPVMVTDTLRGQSRWLVVMVILMMLLFLVFAAATGYKFLTVTTFREMFIWAIGFMVCLTAVSMMKIWFWMELNKNTTLRQIKRLELQLARLAGRLEDV